MTKVHLPETEYQSNSEHQSITVDAVLAQLATVIDPELHMPITEMGLVYGVKIDQDGVVIVTMTLTTVGCPLFETIHADVSKAVSSVDGVTGTDIDLTFDVPWHPGMMSESARAELGIDG